LISKFWFEKKGVLDFLHFVLNTTNKKKTQVEEQVRQAEVHPIARETAT
jgi:hypothetical protein